MRIQVSQAVWPTPENELAFYETYIRPHPEVYGDKFNAYEVILEQSGNLSRTELLARVSTVGLIGQNFIQIKVGAK